jgi:hypothetical protein
MQGDLPVGHCHCAAGHEEAAMNFAICIIGFLILIGGVAWALVAAKVPSLYVAIACVILLGLGIISGVTKTRTKDPS